MRLDVYLVENKICSSREKAKDLITKGGVRVNGVAVSKPSFQVELVDTVEYPQQNLLAYVSKGGLKLEKAIQKFGLDFKGKTVLDIGASTGGFTDCALKHGAKYVWAVDVGSNQLDSSLRVDSRVCSLENTDIRELHPNIIGSGVDIVVGDLSFISLSHVLQHISYFITNNEFAVLLIKPQFEVGPKNIGKGGIVKDPKAHINAIKEIVKNAHDLDLELVDLTESPIIDPRKNIEYLALFKRKSSMQIDFSKVVYSAFLAKKKLLKNK